MDGSISEDETGFTELEDDAPLRRFVTRSRSFAREEFERLIRNPDLFAVHSSVDDSVSPRASPPAESMSSGAKEPLLPRHRPTRFGAAAGGIPRSVFGLPILRPDTGFYRAWSALILFLDLTYSALVVPISLGMLTSFSQWNWTTVLDYGAGALFFADMLISFHVGYIAMYNLKKVLVMNGRLVAKFYVYNDTFLFDSLSVGAWLMQISLLVLLRTTALQSEFYFFPMEAIRLVRFLRVFKLIRRLLVSSIYAPLDSSSWLKWLRNPSLSYISYILYVIVVMVNALGCMLNLVAAMEGYEDTWANHYKPFIRAYAADGVSPLTAPELRDDVSRVWRYFVGCYWALTTIATVGFGDVTAVTMTETVVVMVVEVIGIMFFGILISTISELLSNSNKQARRAYTFRKKILSVEQWMHSSRMPRHLQHKIKSYYALVWLHHVENLQGASLFRELPHTLRNEVAWNALSPAFRRLPIFAELDESEQWVLCSCMTPLLFGPGEEVLFEGDPAETCLVLVEGEIELLRQFQDAGSIVGPAVLTPAVLLQGRLPAFKRQPFSIRTLCSCSCWQIRWKSLRLFMARKEGQADAMQERALEQLGSHVLMYPDLWPDEDLQHPVLRRAKQEASDIGAHSWSAAQRAKVQVRFAIPEDDEEEEGDEYGPDERATRPPALLRARPL